MGGGWSTPRHDPPTPRKRPGTSCIRVCVSLRADLDTCGISRPLPGVDPRTVQPVESRYTYCAIPAHYIPLVDMKKLLSSGLCLLTVWYKLHGDLERSAALVFRLPSRWRKDCISSSRITDVICVSLGVRVESGSFPNPQGSATSLLMFRACVFQLEQFNL